MIRLLPYSFLAGVVLLAVVGPALAEAPIMDVGTLLLFAAAVALYARSRKPLFYAFYFNYLAFWVCLGNINFLIFRQVWSGWDGDVVLENSLYAVFLFVFAVGGFFWNRRVPRSDPVPPTRSGLSFPVFLTGALILVVVFSVIYLPAIGYGGVYLGRLSDENRFSVELPSILNRLAYAFHVAAALLAYRLARSGRGRMAFALFMVWAFFVLTAGGARWAFFQVVVTLFFLLVLTGNLSFLVRHRALAGAIAVVFVLFQPLLAILRSGAGSDEVSGRFGPAIAFGMSWGGEFRDGAAALSRLGPDQKAVVAENYLSSLIIPVVPRQITAMFGVDKDSVGALAGAFVMQEEYGVGYGSIRIGGIVEAFLWLGYLGVVLVGVTNGLVAYWIDSRAHRAHQSLVVVLFVAFCAASLLYFVQSQSNSLLAPPFAFVSILLLLKLAQLTLGLPNSLVDQERWEARRMKS